MEEEEIDWEAIKVGDNAIEWLKKLERMVRKRSTISITGNVRVHEYEDGKEVIGEDVVQNFDGAFSVSLAGLTEVRVDPGTVNMIQPLIDGVQLDGKKRNGQPAPDGVPSLSIKEGGDKETRGSYVCLKVKALGEHGQGFDPADEEALTVAHLKTLEEGVAEGPGYPETGELIGYRPLAFIEWDEEAKIPRRIRQIRYFDQEYEFIKAEEGRPGRHEFAPAP